MNARPTALDIPSDAASFHEPRAAHRRFAAVVGMLAQLARDRPRPQSPRPLDPDDAPTTRRPNRTRQLLGARPRAGKSRSFARVR